MKKFIIIWSLICAAITQYNLWYIDIAEDNLEQDLGTILESEL